MGNIYRFCRSYAENFTPESRGIFLIGDTGLGKTHLSLAIAKDVISKGCMVAYGSAQDFLRRWKKSISAGRRGRKRWTAFWMWIF